MKEKGKFGARYRTSGRILMQQMNLVTVSRAAKLRTLQYCTHDSKHYCFKALQGSMQVIPASQGYLLAFPNKWGSLPRNPG